VITLSPTHENKKKVDREKGKLDIDTMLSAGANPVGKATGWPQRN
jgi:hypothetical protein